ncbi:MAG: HDOD domain-containing protein [Gammaproteobacteria bacterium]
MNAADLVRQVSNIFSLPEMVMRVNEILRRPEPNFVELETVISHDPGMTASILKVANSSFYNFPSKIDTLARAITIIGLKELRSIVIGASVAKRFKDIASELVNMDIFWYHSVARAILARDLAVVCKCGSTERFFIAGLLSSIGKLILYTQYPEKSAEIIRMGKHREAELAEAEREAFGFDYAELSAELLKEWKLPAEIWEMIAFQLEPLESPNQKMEACILHVALSISGIIQPSVGIEIEDIETDISNAVFDAGVLAYLGLNLEQIETITSEVLFEAMEIISILRPQSMMI